jgi:hypothetical protein
LTQGAVFWILMGRSLLLRDRELVSSDISTGQDVVFSGLVAEDCSFLSMGLEVNLY